MSSEKIMSSENKPKRIFYIDQLRTLAIIGIICIHIALIWEGRGIGEFNRLLKFIFVTIGRYGVPIFLSLTGVLLLNRNYGISDFLKKRFPRIIWPWLFWMAIAIAFIIFTQMQFPYFNSIIQVVNFAVKEFLTSRWYVWMLIGVYLVLPIINEFVKSKGLKGVEYYLILWIITSIICCISIYFNISTYFLDLTFFAGPLGFVLLGYYLHNKTFKYSPNKLVIIGMILFILGIVLKVILICNGVDMGILRYYIFQTKSHLEIDIFVIMQTTGIFLMIKYLNDVNMKGIGLKIAKIFNTGIPKKLTESLSRSSYGMYLNHYIIIGFITLFITKLSKHSALKWIPFLTIVVVIISWGIILVINRIPHMNRLTGYH